MSAPTAADYIKVAHELYADLRWKGAFWDHAKAHRFINEMHRAAEGHPCSNEVIDYVRLATSHQPSGSGG